MEHVKEQRTSVIPFLTHNEGFTRNRCRCYR